MSIQFGGLILFDVRELSKKFGLHPVSVRQLFSTGKLKGRKIGKRWYLTEDALREYFDEAGKPGGKA
mgnify:FL=1